jgi:hypothetical protein
MEMPLKPLIAEFVSHLLVRTNNLRQGMVQMGRAMGEGMLEQFERVQPGSQFHDVIQKGITSSETQETIERELEKVPENMRPIVRTVLEENLHSPLILDHLRTIARRALPMVDFPGAVQNAQAMVLEEDNRVKERAKQFEPFTWQLFDYEPNALVLGDHGPFGLDTERKVMKNLIFFDRIAEVYLPISHQRLLVGNLDGETLKPDADRLNTNSAELSREFFVARSNSIRERNYLLSLGKRAGIYSEKELRSWIEEGVKASGTQ